MTGPEGSPRTVVCPICGRTIDWAAAEPVRLGEDGRAVPVVREAREGDQAWQDRLITSSRPCAELGQPNVHLLPYDYGDYTPITVGLVGRTSAGKTHLLAAMIHRLCSNDPELTRLGLSVGPLDLAVHQRFLAAVVTPLIARRQELAGTPAASPVEFCDALKVTNAEGRSFALTFFDLAGERLARANDAEVRFYGQANALIFVVDPKALPRWPGAAVTADPSFDVAMRHLDARRGPGGAGPLRSVAAAVVVAKADLVRFEDRLVSDWMARASAEEEVELDTVEQESEDVFTYLSRRGARPWLRPAQECYRSTLHFASATNGPAKGSVYPPETFRQRRVLKPLLAVFAMTGILDPARLVPAGAEGDG